MEKRWNINYSPEEFCEIQKYIDSMRDFPAPWNNALALASTLYAANKRLEAERESYRKTANEMAERVAKAEAELEYQKSIEEQMDIINKDLRARCERLEALLQEHQTYSPKQNIKETK